MHTLEKYEWDNIWWNDTWSKDSTRVLMVGDSISVGYRDHVNKLLSPDGINADVLSTSKGIDNPALLTTLDAIAEQSTGKISLIHFNNGLHGFHLSAEEYAEHYERAVCHMLEKYPDAKLVLALSTPVTMVDHKEQYDPKLNKQVLERNEKVRGFAEKYNLPINDLYSLIDGKLYARKQDAFHYYSTGYKIMAKQIARVIKTELGK